MCFKRRFKHTKRLGFSKIRFNEFHSFGAEEEKAPSPVVRSNESLLTAMSIKFTQNKTPWVTQTNLKFVHHGRILYGSTILLFDLYYSFLQHGRNKHRTDNAVCNAALCPVQPPCQWKKCCRAWWTTTWWTRRESEPRIISGLFPVKLFTPANANWTIWRNWWEKSCRFSTDHSLSANANI